MLSSARIAPPTRARILIVEDEGLIAHHIASQLVSAGYEVSGIVDSCEETLAQIPELHPDLILMDIHIKGSVDGIETAAAVRDRFDIPVIYLTAHTDRQTIDRAKMTGASGFLVKPFQSVAISTSIEMALHKNQADREVRRQRAWMATVLATMPDAVVVVDRDLKIQFLNGPAEVLTGWSNREVQDRDVEVLLPLLDLRSLLPANEILSPPFTPPSPSQMPRGLITTNRSGKKFPIEGEIAKSVDGRRMVGAVITFRDATSRQVQETQIRQESKMQAVGLLAAGVAHDFNNMLCVILGYTEILCLTAPDDATRNALAEIRKASEGAVGITKQLLKFSRNEPIEKQDVDLNAVIRDTEEILRRLAGPAVKCNFTLESQGAVRADHGQLKQVLTNLVVNARDAMPEGGKITIETANVDIPRAGLSNQREKSIALSVTDTGTGMSAETAERLFEPFFTTKEAGQGTGLGLSIVHTIVTDLGGTIQVESALGKGTIFTIYVPLVLAPDALPVVSGSSSGCELRQARTILLAEDQDSLRRLFCTFLVSSGWKVLEAHTGEDAIRVANEFDGGIDLLITDVMMPKGSGFEVARTLTARRAEMKIMFISGYSQELLEKHDSLPAGLFLPKPFGKKEFLNNIANLLDLQGQEKELFLRPSV